jgi:lipopolysaccharide/colanic/teichoic acid biosynthesis glycosyltransferase
MSFVGPRPLTQTELNIHYGLSAGTVLSAKPGLTGLWQVMGRNRLSYPQRLRLDLFLVKKRCFGLYFGIVARTIPLVVLGKDSW